MDEPGAPTKADQKTRKGLNRSIRNWTKTFAPYVLCVIVLVAVNNHWKFVVREIEDRCQKQVEKATSEREAIQAAFDKYRDLNPTIGTTVAGASTKATEAQTTIPEPNTPEKDQMTVLVTLRSAATVWGDDLHIILTEPPYMSRSSKYKVSGIVFSPDHERMKINSEVGSTVSYSGKNNFDIEILAADKAWARFLIKRH